MKHGMSNTRIYNIWYLMRARCYKPSNNRFKSYGGRGIKVEWKDFETFLKDMHSSYQDHCKEHGERNTSIDRIDSNGNYSKKNCRWNTLGKQNLNRTNNHLITYKGKTKTLSEWSREKGFRDGLIIHRLSRGWSIKKILETPVRKTKNQKTWKCKKCLADVPNYIKECPMVNRQGHIFNK